jgi:ribose-phosphate pyrophosphokinase
MSYINPQHLGIIACPGANGFAEKIISHLREITKHDILKKIKNLSGKYGVPEKEMLKEYNLFKHLIDQNINELRTPEELYVPGFKINTKFTRFTNGEFKAEIMDSIRGLDVFIVQDIANHYPIMFHNAKIEHSLSVNDQIFCLLVAVDAALQAGAGSVTIVIPSYPYARQHRKKSREGLTASRFGQMLEFIGVKRIITLDIHSKEIENSFNNLRLENLHASHQIIKELKGLLDLNNPDIVVISPDTGSIDRNKFYSQSLSKPLGLIYKERDYSKLSYNAKESNITNVNLLGDVKNKTVIIADDMLGTGGTFLEAITYLKKMGAKKIICAVSLPFFTGDAIKHFDEAYKQGIFYRLIGTNAVYHDEKLHSKEWYISTDVSLLFAESIFKLHNCQSLSLLLDNRNIIKDILEKE